jgi:aldoxime dehydratase
MPAGYTPPVPAYTARYAPGQTHAVMAYHGVQFRDPTCRGAAVAGLQTLRSAVQGEDAPRFADLAQYRDPEGWDTLVWTAYWADLAAHQRWQQHPVVHAFWQSDERLSGGLGWFREVACPGVDRFETLMSSPDGQEAVARLADGVSGEILEHAYWGGMRDRLPVSQTDALVGAAPARPPQPRPGQRVAFAGAHNMALIRSGQNWAPTTGAERERYLGEVEPVLRAGMDFLSSSEGLTAGCLSNRYLRVLDEHFAPTEQSYGLSWWYCLAHMEAWAEKHPMHQQIFGAFMGMLQAIAAPPSLRLYHEVSVLQAGDAHFEYLNCHPGTGLLRLSQ